MLYIHATSCLAPSCSVIWSPRGRGLPWDRTGGAHNGRVYEIWTQETPDESDNTDIMLQYSDDNGTTWSSAVKLNDDHTANSQYNPAIALDQTSQLRVLGSVSRDALTAFTRTIKKAARPPG